MDILGPFPMATGQRRFVIVAIDFFMTWTEAEPLATITEAKCEEFFWKNVVCRFGIPKVLITDNGKQFDNSKFRSFCENLFINLSFTSVAYPQANGQTKNMNRSILQENEANLRGNLDLLDDVRAQALDRVISTKQRVARYYNRRVWMRLFRVGDLVLRKLEVSDPKAAIGKLSLNWEGSYKILKGKVRILDKSKLLGLLKSLLKDGKDVFRALSQPFISCGAVQKCLNSPTANLGERFRLLRFQALDLLLKATNLGQGLYLFCFCDPGHIHRHFKPFMHLATIAVGLK
ncbi:hypothetical protein RJ639_033135 [Escallonia herrerae]|uniref:Integrase catalytic domain-containing protein n=1 Tax=Escallonia herrerae TaxID=1293975 RepID=A0AA89B9D6_9ASTE|nr:hypothetical protein RJ639_033135 [Escallonia herrerae]